MKLFVACIILLNCTCLFAQEAGFDPARPATIIPPSPGVASLLKDVDVPVSYYTGTAQFTLPVCTLVAGSISVPITLSYSATGLKVEEDASLAGMGWSLNAGGLIGLSSPASGKPGQLSYVQAANTLNMPAYTSGDVAEQAWLSSLTACNNYAIAKGNYNLMPDVYYLNFNGNSAKFFFDRSGNIFITPYKAWKITGSPANDGAFTVVTDNGMIYKFELLEHTTTVISSTSTDYLSQKTANDAWFLTKIISADKYDTMHLSYTPISYTQNSKNPEETNQSLMTGQIAPAGVAIPLGQNINTITMNQQFNTYLLNSISCKTQRVDFICTANRKDIDAAIGGNPYELDTIRLFSKNGSSLQLMKQFIFGYQYSNAASITAKTKRLFLNSLVEKGTGNSSKNILLAYKGIEDLPARDSKGQDYWGFFNGKNGNTTMIPTMTDNTGKLMEAGDREPDPQYADAGMLSKITYATGGYDSIEYEMHMYSLSNNGGPSGKDSATVAQIAGASAGINHKHTEKTFQITFAQTITLTYNLHQLRPGGDGAAAVSFVNITNPLAPIVLFQAGGVTQPITPKIFLNAGWYKITADTEFDVETAAIGIDYSAHVLQKLNGLYAKYAGGIRIKRLLQHDGLDHSNDLIKRFSYTLDDSTSSGVLNNYPVYSDMEYVPMISNTGSNPMVLGYWHYFVRHSTSQVALGSTHGSNVGYSKITILYGNGGENGKEELYYNNSPKDGGSNGYPYAPKWSYDDLRGLLVRKIIYDNHDSAIQKTTNNYDLNNMAGKPGYKWIYGVKTGQDRSDIVFDGNGCPAGFSTFKSSYYKIFQLWPVLTSTIDTLIDKQRHYYTTITNYYYDPVTTQLISRNTYKSDNSLVSRKFRYPKDFSTISPYNEMINRNNIAAVIEQVDSNITRNKELTRQKTNYTFWQSNTLIEPASIQKSTGGNLLTIEETINSYDSAGNILQLTGKDGIVVSYFWGYNKKYPVAKITGTDYNSARQLINQLLIDNPDNLFTDDQVRTELNKLRVNLPGAMVTTYTYLPLKGMTSETDPRGKTTYYEYDDFGRLAIIRDQDKNILKRICYNYAGQPEDCK